jgi:hypothetical protein
MGREIKKVYLFSMGTCSDAMGTRSTCYERNTYINANEAVRCP